MEALPHVDGNNAADSTLEIDWTDGDIMPQQLLDILAAEQSQSHNEATHENNEGSELEVVEESDEFENIIDAIFDEEEEVYY